MAGSGRAGHRARGLVALSLPPPDDGSLPALEGLGPLVGLSGVWDGERALFVGGLTDPLFLAFAPDDATWEVRPTPRARAGADLAWTGRQLLVWGGVDRMGPVIDLDVWTDPE